MAQYVQVNGMLMLTEVDVLIITQCGRVNWILLASVVWCLYNCPQVACLYVLMKDWCNETVTYHYL